MLQCVVIAGLIQFALHLVQIPDFAICKSPHAITEPRPCFVVGLVQGVAALAPTLRCTYTLVFDPKISNFDSSSKGLYSTALLSSLYAPDSTGVFWHYFAFSKLVSGQNFRYIGQLNSLMLTVNANIFFHIGSVVRGSLEQSAFYYTSWWLWWNCPLQR